MKSLKLGLDEREAAETSGFGRGLREESDPPPAPNEDFADLSANVRSNVAELEQDPAEQIGHLRTFYTDCQQMTDQQNDQADAVPTPSAPGSPATPEAAAQEPVEVEIQADNMHWQVYVFVALGAVALLCSLCMCIEDKDEWEEQIVWCGGFGCIVLIVLVCLALFSPEFLVQEDGSQTAS